MPGTHFLPSHRACDPPPREETTGDESLSGPLAHFLLKLLSYWPGESNYTYAGGCSRSPSILRSQSGLERRARPSEGPVAYMWYAMRVRRRKLGNTTSRRTHARRLFSLGRDGYRSRDCPQAGTCYAPPSYPALGRRRPQIPPLGAAGVGSMAYGVSWTALGLLRATLSDCFAPPCLLICLLACLPPRAAGQARLQSYREVRSQWGV